MEFVNGSPEDAAAWMFNTQRERLEAAGDAIRRVPRPAVLVRTRMECESRRDALALAEEVERCLEISMRIVGEAALGPSNMSVKSSH